jgi:hypothetical protein
MNQVSAIKDKRRMERERYEEEFYASWGGYLPQMSDDALLRLNADKLAELNASYPDTLLWLKHQVLCELARRGL